MWCENDLCDEVNKCCDAMTGVEGDEEDLEEEEEEEEDEVQNKSTE